MSLTQQGLAWNNEVGEKKRLVRISSAVLPFFLLTAIYISWIELPKQDREHLEALPPQLAKVILKKKQQVIPKVKKLEKVVEKKEAKKIKPEVKVAQKPKLKKPVAKIAKSHKVKPKAKDIQLARQKAKKSGLLAMSKQLSALSSLANNVKLDTPKMITAKTIARKSSDRLASSVSTVHSAGVNNAVLSHKIQTMSLASRQVTEVEHADEIASNIEVAQQQAQQIIAQRSREEIRRTMDANKSAIDSIYRRALRKKPSLQGVFTAQLVVETNGHVSSCMAQESTLNEPNLESKICKRLRLVNFGSKSGVAQTTINYPIEFIPS